MCLNKEVVQQISHAEIEFERCCLAESCVMPHVEEDLPACT